MERKWQVLNIIIIVNFVIEIIYGMVQTFFIRVPDGGQFGPLMGTEVSYELMVTRRLYAIETWIAIAGLAIYLAIVYRDQLKAACSKSDKE
jgi:hypothetical protein